MEEDCDGVEAGEYSIVYGTPEAWILNPRWRNMLNSKVVGPCYQTVVS
jgi:hypothetical protein